jgi:DNA-directed RNA polymerase beta subunit
MTTKIASTSLIFSNNQVRRHSPVLGFCYKPVDAAYTKKVSLISCRSASLNYKKTAQLSFFSAKFIDASNFISVDTNKTVFSGVYGRGVTCLRKVLAANTNNLEQSRFSGNKNVHNLATFKKQSTTQDNALHIKDIYDLETYRRSNQDTCLMHRPALTTGEWVESGDLIADNTASMNGELAIGKNILVAYMPWEGYNYEDSILINERLVYDDTYTSVHIERYEIEIREGQQGSEQFTKYIPDLNPSETAHLDDSGIVKIGSWIEEGDILVGKVTPVNPKKQTGYQRLIFKLFDKKVASVRDSSLRAPKGMKANVINVHILDYAISDTQPTKELATGSKSKLGDKKAGAKSQRDLTSDPLKAGFITQARRNDKKPISRPGVGLFETLRTPQQVLNHKLLFPLESKSISTNASRTTYNTSRNYVSKNQFCLGFATQRQELFSECVSSPLMDRVKATLSRSLSNQDSYGKPTKNKSVYYGSSYALQKKLRKSKIRQDTIAKKGKALVEYACYQINLSNLKEIIPAKQSLNLKAPQKLNNKLVATNVHIYLAEKRKIQVGDKMAGRHGNKGIISNILPRQDMPYLPDGTALDIVLNPLGVPSRMNVGQIYECLLGLAGRYLGEHYKVFSFDEMYGAEASRSFVFGKLFEARQKTGIDWLFNPNSPGKIRIFDGRTDECFNQPVTVGIAYMLKLVHMVDDKIHARSTGPYSLVTQQPLRGRAKQGGQRLGEMEVWAIEGFGAAFVLLEMLTLKSDDMTGRLKLWSDLILNHDITIGTPESFKVLVCELQALCLDIGLYTNTSTKDRLSSKVAKAKSQKGLKNKQNKQTRFKKISHLMFMP